MPYIKQINRDVIGPPNLTDVAYPGELNYKITSLCHEHIITHGLNYQILNEVIDVLECAKQELCHTVAVLYEDKKRLENGPVSELDDNSRERLS